MALFSTGYAHARPHGQALGAMTQNPAAVFRRRLFCEWEVERAIEANASIVPSVNPEGGGILYVENGALKYRGSTGAITIIAPA